VDHLAVSFGICNHCGVMTAWRRKNWKFLKQFLRFVWITTPCGKNLQNSVPKVYMATPIDVVCSNVVIFFRRKSVKSWVICLTKKISSLSNCRYCADRAQNLPGPVLNVWLTMFHISSKSVHFRRSYIRMREGCSSSIKYSQYSPEDLRANKSAILVSSYYLCTITILVSLFFD